MSSGWIALNRALLSSDIWTTETFTRGQAWVDLLLLTNYQDGHIRVRGMRIAILRGQCGWSETRLADRWGWSRGKVRRFMRELQEDGRIFKETDNKKTVITICNYSDYQEMARGGSTANRTANRTTNSTKNGTLINKENKENKENNNIIVGFEDFWKNYPSIRPKGPKKRACEKYVKLVKSGVSTEEIIAGLQRYGEYIDVTGSYNKHAITWLNQRGWEEDWSFKDRQGEPRKSGYFEELQEAGKRLAQKYPD